MLREEEDHVRRIRAMYGRDITREDRARFLKPLSDYILHSSQTFANIVKHNTQRNRTINALDHVGPMQRDLMNLGIEKGYFATTLQMVKNGKKCILDYCAPLRPPPSYMAKSNETEAWFMHRANFVKAKYNVDLLGGN
jgi:uncharacterized protein YbgA (DUF1722 family)